MPEPTSLPRYTGREEIAHALTHGLGLALSVAGGATLIVMAGAYGDVRHVVSGAFFVTTLILPTLQEPAQPRFEVIALQHAVAAEAAAVLAVLIPATKVMADPRSNSLLVSADAAGMAQLKDPIPALDQAAGAFAARLVVARLPVLVRVNPALEHVAGAVEVVGYDIARGVPVFGSG